MKPSGFAVLERAAPAAHSVLLGELLVDAGDAAGTDRVERFLAGRPVALIALTHAHADHAGGAARLRDRLGAPVAMHPADHDTVERDAEHLQQPLPRFTVDRELSEADDLPGGVRVVAIPSQTPGHVAFHHRESGVVASGDLLQADDVAWMPFADSDLDLAIAGVRRIAELRPRVVIPGHGPPVTDVAARAEATVARYQQWRAQPDRRAGHHARRFVSAWLTLSPGCDRTLAQARLADVPALHACAAVVGIEPEAMVAATLDQLIGSGAIAVVDGRLEPRFPYES